MATENPSTDFANEEWRPVVGYEGVYEVSSLGRVKRIKVYRNTFAGRILSPGKGRRRAYLIFGLSKNNRVTSFMAHILVCAAFHGPKPSPQHEVAHWDGDGGNNAADNLRWATRKENSADTRRHGRTQRGETHARAKLSLAQVQEIRQLRGKERQVDIAARFGITQVQVSQIQLRKTWKDFK